MAAGAFGFSTTNVAQHIGYKGRPIACRNASRDELKAYCNALKELGKGSIELALTNNVSIVDETEHALLDMLLTESGRQVTWLALLNRDDQPDAALNTLRTIEPLFKKGRRSAGDLPSAHYSDRSAQTLHLCQSALLEAGL